MADWNLLTDACKQAMKAAAEQPGRYGGRYVARNQQGAFVVLDDDDPDAVGDEYDVFAQVMPNKVHPVGGARRFLMEDGSVRFEHD